MASVSQPPRMSKHWLLKLDSCFVKVLLVDAVFKSLLVDLTGDTQPNDSEAQELAATDHSSVRSLRGAYMRVQGQLTILRYYFGSPADYRNFILDSHPFLVCVSLVVILFVEVAALVVKPSEPPVPTPPLAPSPAPLPPHTPLPLASSSDIKAYGTTLICIGSILAAATLARSLVKYLMCVAIKQRVQGTLLTRSFGEDEDDPAPLKNYITANPSTSDTELSKEWYSRKIDEATTAVAAYTEEGGGVTLLHLSRHVHVSKLLHTLRILWPLIISIVVIICGVLASSHRWTACQWTAKSVAVVYGAVYVISWTGLKRAMQRQLEERINGIDRLIFPEIFQDTESDSQGCFCC